MGLIIPAFISTRTGATFTNAYVTIMADMNTWGRFNICKTKDLSGDYVYSLTTMMYVYASNEARISNLSSVDNQPYTVPVVVGDISGDLFTLCYNRIKEDYPDATDA